MGIQTENEEDKKSKVLSELGLTKNIPDFNHFYEF